MNGNNEALSPPDFDKMVWKCPCCSQERTDKFIKVMSHDISVLLGHETGTVHINCKYCADMPGCQEKAHNREWVLTHFLGKNYKDANYKIEL